MSLPAYFITKVSRKDPNFAKKLAGQKGYLLQYDRMSEEEKLAKYLEIEPELLIFDQSRKMAEIKKLQKEKSELESDYADSISNMGDRMLNLELEIKKLKNKN